MEKAETDAEATLLPEAATELLRIIDLIGFHLKDLKKAWEELLYGDEKPAYVYIQRINPLQQTILRLIQTANLETFPTLEYVHQVRIVEQLKRLIKTQKDPLSWAYSIREAELFCEQLVSRQEPNPNEYKNPFAGQPSGFRPD